MTKHLLPAILISAAIPMTALAQSDSTSPTAVPPKAHQNNAQGTVNDTTSMGQSADASSMANPFVTVPSSGAWRVSDLEGKAVYGSEGENIGEINDVLVSQNGSVNAVIIGVGGFLGIGEKDVAVNMNALQLGPGDTQVDANAAAHQSGAVSGETTASTNNDAATSATPRATGTGTASGSGAARSDASGTGNQMAANDAAGVRIGEDGLPDRIIVNVTRQQLQDAPAFEGVRP